jgi:hypothetical protein
MGARAFEPTIGSRAEGARSGVDVMDSGSTRTCHPFLVAFVAAIAICPGCFCAAGVPPLRGSVGATGRVADGDERVGAAPADRRADVRLAVAPLQLLRPRPFDAAVGYLVEPGSPSAYRAWFLDVDAVIVHRAMRGGGEWRLSLGPEGRIAYEAGRGGGFGAALRLALDRVDFVSQTGCRAGFWGGAYGDGGLGLFVEGATTWLDATRIAQATGGVTFRVPAAGFFGAEHGRCDEPANAPPSRP